MTTRSRRSPAARAGIGKAICEDLLARGYEVVSLARRKSDIVHAQLHSIEVDLADRAATAEAAHELAHRFDVTRWCTTPASSSRRCCRR